MADIYEGAFGGYSNVTQVVSAGAQTAILAQVAKLKALLPDITQNVVATTPDFDRIPPETSVRLRAEVDALSAAIDAAPTS